jgi:hypothetical protein
LNLEPHMSSRGHDEVGRNSHAPSHRFSIKSMLVGVFLFSFILAAYSRGSQLLGTGVGLLYAFVACLLVYLILRSLIQIPLPKIQLAILAIVVLLISAVFAFPHLVNPDLGYVIDTHRAELTAHRELSRLLASDQAFAGLQVTTTYRKGLWVGVQGSVGTDQDLDKLRTRVRDECEFLSNCYVTWDIQILSTGAHYSDDSSLFEERSNP